MERWQHVWVGLETADEAPFTPVQVQKLFFLLDRKDTKPPRVWFSLVDDRSASHGFLTGVAPFFR